MPKNAKIDSKKILKEFENSFLKINSRFKLHKFEFSIFLTSFYRGNLRIANYQSKPRFFVSATYSQVHHFGDTLDINFWTKTFGNKWQKSKQTADTNLFGAISFKELPINRKWKMESKKCKKCIKKCENPFFVVIKVKELEKLEE